MSRLTVGHQAFLASKDTTKYDPAELAEALTADLLKHVWDCIEAHDKIINEPEFCVVCLTATDCLIKGVKRRKFYAWPYLPSPRPNQICFLYERKIDKVSRLWSLPNAEVMAVISEMPRVDKRWHMTKIWCDSFFKGTFWEDIRAIYGTNMLSETEFLAAHREEFIKMGGKDIDPNLPQPFDFSKIPPNKVVNAGISVLKKNSFDGSRKTETGNGNIPA